MIKRLKSLTNALRQLGLRDTMRLIGLMYGRHKYEEGKMCMLWPKSLQMPIGVRPGTSDYEVFIQIFLRDEYGRKLEDNRVQVVVDCGANVGYFSALFASRFPQARIIAIEPDKDNYRAMEKNLSGYGERVVTLNAAVWSHTTKLVERKVAYRDGGHWARQFEADSSGSSEDTIDAIDLNTLLAKYEVSKIDVLKMDIEGAEAVVLDASKSDLSWITKVSTIAIELHDDSCFGPSTPVFETVFLRTEDFRRTEIGELQILHRVMPDEKCDDSTSV